MNMQTVYLHNIKAKTENMTAAEERAAEAKEYILGFYDRVVESIDGAE